MILHVGLFWDRAFEFDYHWIVIRVGFDLGEVDEHVDRSPVFEILQRGIDHPGLAEVEPQLCLEKILPYKLRVVTKKLPRKFSINIDQGLPWFISKKQRAIVVNVDLIGVDEDDVVPGGQKILPHGLYKSDDVGILNHDIIHF